MQLIVLSVALLSRLRIRYAFRFIFPITTKIDDELPISISFFFSLSLSQFYRIRESYESERICFFPFNKTFLECFWRVRSGFGMPTDVVRKSLIVDDLGECQAECMIMQDFMCRSFAFK